MTDEKPRASGRRPAESVPDSPPLNWAFINPVRAGWGGMEGWMLRLAQGLRARGDRCVMIGRATSRWREECGARGFPFEPLAFGGDIAPATWWRLRRILFNHQADLVIAKGFKQARWARLVRPRAAIAVKIPSANELGEGWFDRWTAQHILDRILTDNEAACAEARLRPGYPANRMHAVPNGIEPPGPWPDPPRRLAARRRVLELAGHSSFLIAWIGRLYPVKAPEVALRAFAAAGGEGKLILFGDGPLQADLRTLARTLNIADRVVFAGWRDDAREWLWGCDALINSSLTEGLPNAVLEAMAAGLPVIATDAGGTREAVQDGVTGYVVAVGDAEALGRRLAVVREDVALRHRFGAAGAERVRRHFTLDAMAQRIREIMADALAERRGWSGSK